MDAIFDAVNINPDDPPETNIRAILATLGIDVTNLSTHLFTTTGRYFHRNARVYAWHDRDAPRRVNGMLLAPDGCATGYFVHCFRRSETLLIPLYIALDLGLHESGHTPEILDPGSAFEERVGLARELQGLVGEELMAEIYAEGDHLGVEGLAAFAMLEPRPGGFALRVLPSVQARDRAVDLDRTLARAVFDAEIAPALRALGFDCDRSTPWLSATPAEVVFECTREIQDLQEAATVLRALKGCPLVAHCGSEPHEP